jgi:hypothetical protein
LLALTCGAAALTKNQGLLLIGWVFVGLFLTAWGRGAEERRSRGATQHSALSTFHFSLFTFYFLLPSLTLAAPLWWRNWGLYGDFTAANQFVLIAHGNRGFTVWESLAQWPSVWNSLFAVFGWFNILAPRWVQWVWGSVVVIGFVGTALAVLTQRSRGAEEQRRLRDHHLALSTQHLALFTFLAGWAGLVTAALIAFNMQTPAAQGRLLFPALLPFALLIGYGLSIFQSFRLSVFQSFSLSQRQSAIRIPQSAFLLLLLATNLTSLLLVIPRAFALPVVGDESLVPTTAARFDTPLGQNLTLLAAEIHTERTQPEGIIPLTLVLAGRCPSLQPPRIGGGVVRP